MVRVELTAAERRFRLWMFLSSYMYAIAGLFFLIAGMHIAPFINFISEKYIPVLSPYPLPADVPEGSFWLVLSLSMMAMITWICRAAYLDIRRNGRLVHVLLLSKFCSSMFYLYFFITTSQLAHLVGVLTDGPLFLVTLLLWIPAAAGDRFIDETEEDILAAIGEAVIPQGGAFECGYADYREESLRDARRMFAKQEVPALAFIRVMMRLLDILPILTFRSMCTLRRMPLERRQKFLRSLEESNVAIFRQVMIAIKLFAVFPFFNNEEAARAVGYLHEEDAPV